MKSHSEFGASSAKRLIECPGSLRLTRALAARGELVDKPSVYAAQGTAAHALAENLLALRNDPVARQHMVDTVLDHQVEEDGHQVLIDADFIDHVQTYVKYIETLEAFDYDLHFEQRVSPTLPWDRQGEKPPIDLFGTADCCGVNRKAGDIVVVDLKFGSGVKVDVFANPQLLYYALGVISMMTTKLPPAPVNSIHTPVELVVVQPRVIGGHEPKLFNTTVGDIIQWGDDVLRPAVERALKASAPLNAGEHCKWCPAIVSCPELDRLGKDKVKALFSDGMFEDDPKGAVSVLGRRALADDLLLAATLEPWIEALREEAIRRMERGEPVPWHKLVAKRAIRKWIDEAAVIKAVGKDILAPPTALSPAQAEKKISHVDLSPYWVKQSSGNTIAHESDPRPAAMPKSSTLLQDLKGSSQ
jgi:RecB family exonuclease